MHPIIATVCSKSSLNSPRMRPLRQPQWHYTSLAKLKSILREGRLRTSAWHRDGRLIARAAWTSAAAIWEPSAAATKIITTQREFAVADILGSDIPPIARIGIAADGLLNWAEYLAMAGVANAHIWHLAECGYACGADPENWALCPGSIPSSAWLRVEIWAGAWVPIEITVDPELRLLAALVPAGCRRGFSDFGIDTLTAGITTEVGRGFLRPTP